MPRAWLLEAVMFFALAVSARRVNADTIAGATVSQLADARMLGNRWLPNR